MWKPREEKQQKTRWRRTYFARGQTDDDQVALGALDLAEDEALLLVGDPGGLLGIVGLGLIDALLFQRHVQVLGGIGIGSRALHDVAGHFGFFSTNDDDDDDDDSLHVDGGGGKATRGGNQRSSRTALELPCNNNNNNINNNDQTKSIQSTGSQAERLRTRARPIREVGEKKREKHVRLSFVFLFFPFFWGGDRTEGRCVWNTYVRKLF